MPCFPPPRLCIKVGRGQGDGDIGTRVLGLGTWGSETKDLRTSSIERGDVWDGDAGTSNTETQGTRDVTNYSKVGGKCDVSFFVKICYLWSTLDSIFQNPHWTPYDVYTKYFFIIGVSALTIVGAIHSTKLIQTGPTRKSGLPQKMDQFFRNFSGWTEPIL